MDAFITEAFLFSVRRGEKFLSIPLTWMSGCGQAGFQPAQCRETYRIGGFYAVAKKGRCQRRGSLLRILPRRIQKSKLREAILIFNKGFIFRFGQGMKDMGERMAHIRVLGIPVLRWCCRPIIALGLAIKRSVMNCPAADLSEKK
jgi:hypothetical protein